MGAFTLTNGALLGGVAILVAPVIAHLLQRRARKPIVFPSIAFLQATAAQQSRLHKLRRLFLMLLRVLALACIVLAFTRPVWWTISVSGGERRSATAVVFVIDRSLSTSRQAAGASLFDRLKSEALDALDDLQQGIDVAGVVWADAQSIAVFPRLSKNIPALHSEVSHAVAGQARADFPAAIHLAMRLLESHSGPKRLVILTDRQASNWKSFGAGDSSELPRPAGIDLVVPAIEVSAGANVGLSAPSMRPERPRPEAPVEMTALIQNHSEATRIVGVRAEWEGTGAPQAISSATISIGAGESTAASMNGAAPLAGIAAVRWNLKEADALAGDDALWLTASAGPGVPLVIASDDSPDDPGTAAYYLMRALAPFDEESDSNSSFATRHVAASRLTAWDLADARVLFLGYSGVLKQEAAAVIVQFVRQGGSLLIFAGDGPADRNLQLLDDAAKGTLTPWRLLSRREAPRRTPFTIDRGRWTTRWLREFDEPSQLALREIAFRRVWQAGAPATDAETLLTFADKEPAAGLRHCGMGQCLVLNFSPESTTGDLGKTGTFVALVQMLTSQLTQTDNVRSTFLVGERLAFQVAEPIAGTLAVLAPDGKSSAVSSSAGAKEFQAGRAMTVGIHRLMAEGTEVAAVAVNVDPRESNLEPLSVDEIRTLLSGSDAVRTSEGSQLVSAESDRLDGGRPLWGGFLLTGLGALSLELLLLGLWRR
ncbi:hypothetical protein Pan44_30150 [Caulifigura coniformis]|uniref:VWFA domain-containing protein n=1 Tax=Caulifigura coniformis TaxID=2527983 RepID=A0A517SFS6_9PLAN|nr:BatA and WFA domain-containing protein [Caulifigura coniformis]QDT54974.1 hypothetical protein Pan44_30150 [Caulifigura coniformis]